MTGRIVESDALWPKFQHAANDYRLLQPYGYHVAEPGLMKTTNINIGLTPAQQT